MYLAEDPLDAEKNYQTKIDYLSVYCSFQIILYKAIPTETMDIYIYIHKCQDHNLASPAYLAWIVLQTGLF